MGQWSPEPSWGKESVLWMELWINAATRRTLRKAALYHPPAPRDLCLLWVLILYLGRSSLATLPKARTIAQSNALFLGAGSRSDQ